jgi:hypothetical protein
LDIEVAGCGAARLRIIAAITEVSVIKKILRYLKLAMDPPPLAPAQQARSAPHDLLFQDGVNARSGDRAVDQPPCRWTVQLVLGRI